MKTFSLGRMTEVILISMARPKGSILLNESIRKPIKSSSRAANIPDALQPAKIIYFRMTKLADCSILLTTLHCKGFIVDKRNLILIFSNSFRLSNSLLNCTANHLWNFYFIKSFTQLLAVRKWNSTRGVSRTAATSKMELFVKIVNGFQPLTIITKCSILNVAAVLDSPVLKILVIHKISFQILVDILP